MLNIVQQAFVASSLDFSDPPLFIFACQLQKMSSEKKRNEQRRHLWVGVPYTKFTFDINYVIF